MATKLRKCDGLARLINKNDFKIILELGPIEEQLPLEILKQAKRIEQYTLIDSWNYDRPEFSEEDIKERKARQARIHDKLSQKKVIYIADSSENASNLYPDESIDFIYIGLDRKKETVSALLDIWWPKLRYWGIISGNGFGIYDGTTRAVKERFNPAQLDFLPDKHWYILCKQMRWGFWKWKKAIWYSIKRR
jgi:hypothetical protein